MCLRGELIGMKEQPNDCQETQKSIAWAAGLFEGEGYVGLTRRQCNISISSTDLDVLEKFHKVVGVGSVFQCKQVEGHKTFWRWKAGTRAAVAHLFELFSPYLCYRRTQTFKDVLSRATPVAPIRSSGPSCGYYMNAVPSSRGFERHRTRREPCCLLCRECRNLNRRNQTLQRKNRESGPRDPHTEETKKKIGAANRAIAERKREARLARLHSSSEAQRSLFTDNA